MTPTRAHLQAKRQPTSRTSEPLNKVVLYANYYNSHLLIIFKKVLVVQRNTRWPSFIIKFRRLFVGNNSIYNRWPQLRKKKEANNLWLEICRRCWQRRISRSIWRCNFYSLCEINRRYTRFLLLLYSSKEKNIWSLTDIFEFVALHAKRVELSSGFIIRNRKSHWKQTHSVVTICLKINPILCGNREKRLSKYHKTIISCSRSREINTLFKLFSLIDTKIRCGAYLFTRIHQDRKKLYIFKNLKVLFLMIKEEMMNDAAKCREKWKNKNNH